MPIENNHIVGIMSDSHDNRGAVKRAVSFFNGAECSLVIHAGDFVAPFTASELEALNCPVKAVFGNCDGEKNGLKQTLQGWGDIRDEPFRFAWGDIRFLLTHTHYRLHEYICSEKFDILIYGHTHKPEIRMERHGLIVNPGETGGWLSGKNTAALLDISQLQAEIVSL